MSFPARLLAAFGLSAMICLALPAAALACGAGGGPVFWRGAPDIMAPGDMALEVRAPTDRVDSQVQVLRVVKGSFSGNAITVVGFNGRPSLSPTGGSDCEHSPARGETGVIVGKVVNPPGGEPYMVVRVAEEDGDIRSSLVQAVDSGDPYALYLLARRNGDEDRQRRALTLLEQAATGGDTTAMRRLASIHRNLPRYEGQNEAARWIQGAAAKGDLTAMVSLANMLADGYGTVIAESPGEARRLIDKIIATGQIGAIEAALRIEMRLPFSQQRQAQIAPARARVQTAVVQAQARADRLRAQFAQDTANAKVSSR